MTTDFLITGHPSRDDFLAGGGRLLLALNSVHADFRSQSGSAQNTGLKRWLRNNGIEVMDNFIVDAQCGSVSVITSSLPVNPDITIEFLSDSVPHAVVAGVETFRR